MTITVIGLDLAKNVFQVHGIDGNGRAVLGGRYGDRRYCRYFLDFRRHALEWRHVTLRITGRVRSPSLVMMYG